MTKAPVYLVEDNDVAWAIEWFTALDAQIKLLKSQQDIARDVLVTLDKGGYRTNTGAEILVSERVTATLDRKALEEKYGEDFTTPFMKWSEPHKSIRSRAHAH